MAGNEHRVTITFEGGVTKTGLEPRLSPAGAAEINAMAARYPRTAGVRYNVTDPTTDRTAHGFILSEHNAAANIAKAAAAMMHAGVDPRRIAALTRRAEGARDEYRAGNLAGGSNRAFNYLFDAQVEREVLAPQIEGQRLDKAAQGRQKVINAARRRAARAPHLPSSAGLLNVVNQMQGLVGANPSLTAGDWGALVTELAVVQSDFDEEFRVHGPSNPSNTRAAQNQHAALSRRIGKYQKALAGSKDPRAAGLNADLADANNRLAGAQAMISTGFRDDLEAAKDVMAEVGRMLNLSSDQLKDVLGDMKKAADAQKGWLDHRGTRLSGAIATRSIMNRLGIAGAEIANMTGEGVPHAMMTGLKSLTGSATDFAMNKFIMDPNNQKRNFGIFAGIGILDAIVGAVGAAIQRGTNIRIDSTQRAYGGDTALSKVLATSMTPGLLSARALSTYLPGDAIAAARAAEYGWLVNSPLGPTLGREASTGPLTGIAGNIGRIILGEGAVLSGGGQSGSLSPKERILREQQRWLQQTRTAADSFLNLQYKGAFATEEAYKYMGMLNAGMGGMSAANRKAFGNRYNEGFTDIILGGHIAGVAALSNLPPEVALRMAIGQGAFGGQNVYGTGVYNGSSTISALGALTQRGLPGFAAQQAIEALTMAEQRGATINYGSEVGFMGSLLNAGVAGGRVGNIFAGAGQTRMGAVDMLTKPYSAAFDSAALAAALQLTGSQEEAVKLLQGANTHDTISMVSSILGEGVTALGASGKWGISVDEAKGMLKAGPGKSESLSDSLGFGFMSAKLQQLLANEKALAHIGAEYTTQEQERIHKVTVALDKLSVTLSEAASDLSAAIMQ